MALNYANIAVKSQKDGQFIVFTTCQEADKGNKEVEKEIAKLNQSEVYFQIQNFIKTQLINSAIVWMEKFALRQAA